MDSKLNSLKVMELEEANDTVTSKMIKKFKLPKKFRAKANDENREKELSLFHSALTTENNEALILFCS